MHKQFGEERTCSSEDMIVDRQTHTDRQTCSSQYFASPVFLYVCTLCTERVIFNKQTIVYWPIFQDTCEISNQKNKPFWILMKQAMMGLWDGILLTAREARDSEWQWHQPGHMQVCTSL